jgi:predicted DCC family thiol-disulfide oxidoreductase YuxK
VRSGPTIRVYDDGRCAFCNWAQRLIERRDRDHRLEFRDYHLHAGETPFAFDELHRAMHVQTADGRWHAGFFAWLEIFKVLPRWRWLGRVLGLPPLRWMGPLMYRVIAANRYRIPNFILRWLGAPQPCGAECAVAEPRR